MKTGQAALEFIMVYGWAILGILVSIGALFYFGFSPQKYLPNTCYMSNNLDCLEYGVYTDGYVFIFVKNILDRGNMVNVIMSLYREDGAICQMGPIGYGILSGEITYFYSDDFSEDCEFNLGERVDLRVGVNFRVEGGSREHYITGRIRTKVEPVPGGDGEGEEGEFGAWGEVRTELICDDGYDNDLDGDTDCADENCGGASGPCGICQYEAETTCNDDCDNDADGDVDCDDSDCDKAPGCVGGGGMGL